MKPAHLAILTLALSAAPAFAGATSVQYRTPAEVAVTRAQGEIGGPVLSDAGFRVLTVRRDKVGESEVHSGESDIMFVVDGKATIVVGGTLTGGHDAGPGELRGSGVSGGKDYVLEPGIVLTIPAGTPHWIRETTPGFRYNVVKVKG